MTNRSVRGAVAALILMPAIWSPPLWAQDAGNYAVRCELSESAGAKPGELRIRMDMIDMLTLRRSLGTIISGVRLDDGRRVVLTGDRGCTLLEVEASRPAKSN